MNDLLNVLRTHEEEISRALDEKLTRGCPALVRTGAGRPAAVFGVLRACCQTGDQTPEREWAKTLCDQGKSPEVGCAEVLAGLHCLERVVRYYVVRTVSQKKALLPALADVSDLVDRLRQCYVAGQLARQGDDRDQIERSLAESQARKHAILESVLDPIITINHEGVITEFNRAAEQVFGHSRDKVLGTQPSEVLFPPSKIAGHQNRIERYLDAGEGSMLGKRIEVTAIRADGETFPAEMAMTINQEQARPVLTFFVRDISQQKKAERKQAHYAAELQRSNRELEQFAYVASHDLQEPLRKIRTFSERLEIKCTDNLDETGHECVQRMRGAAGRMQVLIDGLLTLSRINTREQDYVPVDLTQVAREVVSDLEVQIEQAGGRVEVGSLPTIQADALQMRQLMQNLIGNALKFHRADQPPVVKINGRFVKGRRRRQPRQSSADEQCRIVVEDNGIGFEQKHLERVFNVFHVHPRGADEGTGVGLTICRKICERHGGRITAQSTPGRGTTFEVVLPAARPK